MTFGETPAWVVDLVIDLMDHSEHPQLLFTSGAVDGPVPYDWCPCNALEHVPPTFKETAKAIKAYMEEKVAALPPEAGE